MLCMLCATEGPCLNSVDRQWRAAELANCATADAGADLCGGAHLAELCGQVLAGAHAAVQDA